MENNLKFKSLSEVRRYLDNFSKQLQEEEQLIDKSVNQLAKMAAKKLKANDADIIDFSGELDKPIKKRKRTINVDFPMVKVPSAAELEKNYKIAERLSEQYKYLLSLSNEVKMSFKGTKGSALDATLGAILKLQKDVEFQLRKLFTALSKVAEGHAPKEFKEFVTALAEELNNNKHVECSAIKTMAYAALDAEKTLVFAGYIILSNAVSDEGKVAPTLYITVKWTVGGDVEIFVEHEFIAPTLLKGGEVVVNLAEAGKAIANQLTLEGFSNQIGNLPAELQLKIPHTGLDPSLFTAAEHIKMVSAKEDQLIFLLTADTKPEAVEQISLQIFQEVKAMLRKKRGTKVRMKIEGRELFFTFTGLDQSEGITAPDLDWLQTKYKASDTQIRKIVNIMNNGV